jgi:hypothetical protein
MAEDAFAEHQTRLQANSSIMMQMVQAGQTSTSEYLQLLLQGQAQALQAYAVEMDSLYTENAQYLDMYQADLQALELGINATYQGIMAELGVEESALNALTASYDQDFNSALANLELAYQEAELAESEETWWDNWGSDVLSGVVQIIPLFFLI